MHAHKRRIVGTPSRDRQFRFGVNDTQRDCIEVCAYAVHSEAYHAEILAVPVENPVETALFLPSTVLCPRHGVEKV